ncbi:MAG: cytochrome c-type biogenesis protein CcmH [Deltaproteobacteria bacterium]|nr:cytochrome c-type biogenesis protein CcmH [Deltaproteobacteria bacterium]MBI4197455.1 cytochrome c-type biogenesis protein CcmH [Deltaproteobacteria bacterium]
MKWFFLILLFWSCATSLSTDPESRADRLGKQIRCPVCRGVPIADSPSSLAVEMMGIIRAQIAEGKTDQEILGYFEARYGEWALLEPKKEGFNLSVWIFPLIFILGGALFIVSYAKRRRE